MACNSPDVGTDVRVGYCACLARIGKLSESRASGVIDNEVSPKQGGHPPSVCGRVPWVGVRSCLPCARYRTTVRFSAVAKGIEGGTAGEDGATASGEGA
eukprot:5279633-Prymnesium_polylepis.1